MVELRSRYRRAAQLLAIANAVLPGMTFDPSAGAEERERLDRRISERPLLKRCSCGRVISANKSACRSCARGPSFEDAKTGSLVSLTIPKRPSIDEQHA